MNAPGAVPETAVTTPMGTVITTTIATRTVSTLGPIALDEDTPAVPIRVEPPDRVG